MGSEIPEARLASGERLFESYSTNDLKELS